MHSTEEFWKGIQTEDGRFLVKADAEVTCLTRYAEMHAGIPLLRVFEYDDQGNAIWIWKGTDPNDFLYDMARDSYPGGNPDGAAVLLAEAREAFQKPLKDSSVLGTTYLDLLREDSDPMSSRLDPEDHEMKIRDPAEIVAYLVKYETGWNWRGGDIDARTSQILADVGRAYAALGDVLAAVQEDALQHCEEIDVWFSQKHPDWCWSTRLDPGGDGEEWPSIRRRATFEGLHDALERGETLEEYIGCQDDSMHKLSESISAELEARNDEGRYDRGSVLAASGRQRREHFWHGVRTADGRYLVRADADRTCRFDYASQHAGVPLLEVCECRDDGSMKHLWEGSEPNDFWLTMAEGAASSEELAGPLQEAAELVHEAKDAFQEPLRHSPEGVRLEYLDLLETRTDPLDPHRTTTRLKGLDEIAAACAGEQKPAAHGSLDMKMIGAVSAAAGMYSGLQKLLDSSQQEALNHCESIGIWCRQAYPKLPMHGWLYTEGARKDGTATTFAELRRMLGDGKSLDESLGTLPVLRYVPVGAIAAELERREADGQYAGARCELGPRGQAEDIPER